MLIKEGCLPNINNNGEFLQNNSNSPLLPMLLANPRSSDISNDRNQMINDFYKNYKFPKEHLRYIPLNDNKKEQTLDVSRDVVIDLKEIKNSVDKRIDRIENFQKVQVNEILKLMKNINDNISKTPQIRRSMGGGNEDYLSIQSIERMLKPYSQKNRRVRSQRRESEDYDKEKFDIDGRYNYEGVEKIPINKRLKEKTHVPFNSTFRKKVPHLKPIKIAKYNSDKKISKKLINK